MREEEIEENARLPDGGKRLVSYTGTQILKEQTGEWVASKLIENEQNVKDDKGNIKWNTGGVSYLGGPAFLLNNILLLIVLFSFISSSKTKLVRFSIITLNLLY